MMKRSKLVERNIDDSLQEEINILSNNEEKRSMLSFLTHPIKTIETKNEFNWYFILLISTVIGIDKILSKFYSNDMGESLEISQIIAITLFSSTLLGFISLKLQTYIAFGISKIFKGKATINEIEKTILLASVPLIFLIPIWFLEIYEFGLTFFKEDMFTDIATLKQIPLFLGLSFIESLIYCWSALIFVIGFCKINQFKKMKVVIYIFTSFYFIITWGAFIFSFSKLLPLMKTASISERNTQAYELLEKEEYTKALTLLDSVLKEEPENNTALVNKGWILLETNRYEEAIKAYKKSIEIKPNDTSEYIFLGNAYYELEKYADALKVYHEVPKIGVNRDNAIVYYQMGASYYNLERYADCIFNFNQYLSFTPYDLDAYWYLVYAYENSGNLKMTLEYLDKIIVFDPSSKGLVYKGNLLSHYKKYSEALPIYEKIIDNFPQYPDGYYGKAQILSVYNQPDKAISYLHDAYEIDPSYTKSVLEDPLFDSIRHTQAFKNFIRNYATTDISKY